MFIINLLDSVIKVNREYCPQILLEEYKYEIKKTEIENLVNDDLEQISCDDESDNDSGNESDNESKMNNLLMNLKIKNVF